MAKNFQVDARTILTLGRDSIKDHTTALVELVKNSYDADATSVEIDIITKVSEPYIRVADNGHGMTENVIDNHWLRIGYSEKTIQTHSKRSRRRTGEKGIGRISADRLGAILELHTLAEGDRPFGLRINWDDFDVKGRALESINLDVIEDVVIDIPDARDGSLSSSGTELIIQKLRQSWSRNDIETLDRELSVLISPFAEVSDFNIRINTDVIDGYSRNVGEHVNENFVVRLDINYDGPDENITYIVTERDAKNNGQKVSSTEKVLLSRLIQVTEEEKQQLDFDFGPVTVTLIFYLLRPDIVAGTSISLADLRRFLQSNSGIAVYRDFIRVKPYGNPGASEWDWLSLGQRVVQSPAGPSRTGFRIGPNQIVGAVFVSRDRNPKLDDSSSREGLIQGPAFMALKRLILGCVTLLESQYRQIFAESKTEDQDQSNPTQDVRVLGQELKSLKRDLQSIRRSVSGKVSHDVEQTLDRIELVAERIQETQRSIQELASQATIYRGLASLGIAASVFSHETQQSIASLTGATNNAKKFLHLNPPKVDNALNSMGQAVLFADRVAAWGSFALDRIRRDKRRRRKVNVKTLILDVINHLQPAMQAVNIDLQHNELEDIDTRTFAMDIEAAVLNLLTNAYAACKQKQSNRIVRVQLKRQIERNMQGYEIVVSDSGGGVDPKFREQVWSPLFTTKTVETEDARQQAGTGLGLAIVDSVIKEMNGLRSVSEDPELKGARFRLWFPIEEK